MYKVYVDDILIHDQSSPDKSIHLISPNLKMQENAAGSLEFTIPPEHSAYNEIDLITSTIAVMKEGRIIWTGRAIQEKEDFWHRKKYTCEGALAFLNDTYQPNVSYTATNNRALFASIIEEHNKKVSESRQFHVGAITVINTEENYEYSTDYEKTWDVIKTNFLDRLDGHILLTYPSADDYTPTINYYADYPNLSSQAINFGENLMDFTKNWDLSKICTVVIPKGKMMVTVDANTGEEVTDQS